MIEAERVTDQQMMRLYAINLIDISMSSGNCTLMICAKEREPHRGGRHRRLPFIAWHPLVMSEEVESDLPLDHTVHEQTHDREHRQSRNPFGLLQPHGADRRRIFNPTKAGFHRGVLLLIGLENLLVRTSLATHGRRQYCPPVFLFRDAEDLDFND